MNKTYDYKLQPTLASVLGSCRGARGLRQTGVYALLEDCISCSDCVLPSGTCVSLQGFWGREWGVTRDPCDLGVPSQSYFHHETLVTTLTVRLALSQLLPISFLGKTRILLGGGAFCS